MARDVPLVHGDRPAFGHAAGCWRKVPAAWYREPMPIYEYECQECGNQFEFLVLPPAKDAPACPSCKSANLRRMLSRFAVSSESIRDANWKAARKRGMKVGIEKQTEDAKYKHKVLKETDSKGE